MTVALRSHRRAPVADRLQSLAHLNCKPIFVTMELTLRCNLRCLHCYNFDRSVPYPKQQASTELTPQEIVTAIDAIADLGGLYLYFTGGEVLLHSHLTAFIKHARSHHLRVGVKTNGVLLTEPKVAALQDAGVELFEISLYGASPPTHDAFTLATGSFEQTLAGIQNAVRSGVSVQINICLTRHNAHEIQRFLQLETDLGVGLTFDPQLTARYDGTQSSLDHRMSESQLRDLYAGPLRSQLQAPDFDPQRSVQCSCARSVCGINSAGDVYPCIGAPIVAGNLRQQTLQDIWNHSATFEKIRNLQLKDFRSCAPCADRPYCRRSSGVVYNNTGDYTGPETWTCMEAHVLGELHSLPRSSG